MKKGIDKLVLLTVAVILYAGFANAIDINSCGVNLNQTGATYELINNITFSSGHCLNITADNVILDCKNYKISGPGASLSNDHSIYIEKNINNILVKNCEIVDGYHGIYANGYNSYINNLTVEDTTVDSTSSTGINFNCVTGYDISRVSVTNAGSYGIGLDDYSTNGNLKDIVVESSSGDGINEAGNNVMQII